MADTSPFITIVSGLPRSGTSMMMQMLEAGGVPPLTDALRHADADNPRGYYEFEPVKRTRQDPAWVADAPGRAIKVVHVLLRDLPADHDYRVILMRRRMAQVLASQQTMLQRQGRRGADLPPARLAEVFESQMRQTGQWLDAQPNFAVLPIDYGALIADPGPPTDQINTFLGGTLDVAAMRRAIDPELFRQRQ